jgi:hypothetical protein
LTKALAPAPLASSLASSPLPQLALDIRAKIAELRPEHAVLGGLHPGPEYDAAEAVVERLNAELADLEEQIPVPPRTYADVRMRAELALYWSADTIEDLRLHGDLIGRTLADLAEAVLHFDGAGAALRTQLAGTAPG